MIKKLEKQANIYGKKTSYRETAVVSFYDNVRWSKKIM